MNFGTERGRKIGFLLLLVEQSQIAQKYLYFLTHSKPMSTTTSSR